MLHIVALFLLFFEPRYSWRTTMLAGFAGASALLCVNVMAMYRLGHGIIMSIAFFSCTIPTMLLFFLLSKYRDGRFFFLFCLTDTICFWLLQLTNFLDRLTGDTYVVMLISRLAAFPVVELLFWRYLRRPYRELQSKLENAWWLFAAIGGTYYLLIMFTSVPVGVPMPDAAGLARILLVMLLMPLTYLTIFRSLWRQMQISENTRQMELQKQYANNQQKYQEELAKLYQEENINPMGGCLWSLLPMFVIVPLYSVIRQPIAVFMGLGEEVCNALRTAAEGLGYVAQTLGNGSYGAYEQIYLSDFITRHWSELDWRGIEGAGDRLLQMHFDFLGINMGAQPSTVFGSFSWEWAVIGLILIPVLAAVSSYVQTIVISKSNGQSQEQQASMSAMLPQLPPPPDTPPEE